jgi:glycosyltransferase involved in cell wall biosynthesis
MSPTSGPLVSVIVPVYNGERHLRESLDSVLAQTHPHLEVLVLDDASTDSTPQIVESYGSAVRHVRQNETQGIYENANTGISLATGEYIAIYHADDVYAPTIVERELAYFTEHPDVGVVFALDAFIDAAGREYGKLSLPRELRGRGPLDYEAVVNALLTYMNTFLRCPGAMVPATVYRDVGPYRQDRYRNTADLDMWLRIARRYRIGILEEHLFKYRHFHGNSSQRYHHLRTDPGRTFVILDDYLADGAMRVARPRSLRAYEAHRAEDALHRSVSHYILAQHAAARRVLGDVKPGALLGSGRVQRLRLLVLWGLLQVLLRLPRSEWIAEAFYNRWHRRAPRGAT